MITRKGYYGNDAVKTFWQVMVTIADAALACMVVWGGYLIMVRDQLGERYAQVMEFLPRMALVVLAVHTSMWFDQLIIDFNNGLCALLALNSLPGLSLMNTSAQGLAMAILIIVYGVVGVLLVVQMLMRLALINLLLVTAPLGLLCWVFPQTQSWARLWSSTFVANVLVQFLQVFCLTLGGTLLTDVGSSNLSVIIQMLCGIATLYLTFKLPGMLRSVGGGNAPNVMGDMTNAAGSLLVAVRVAAVAGL